MEYDSPQDHPEDCECDDCGYELHSAHVTLRVLDNQLRAKVRQAQQEARKQRREKKSHLSS